MSINTYNAKLYNIGSWTILSLPKAASDKLVSRGMTMVAGTINGFPFKTPLEPDGRAGHWFGLNKKILEGAKVKAGDTVSLTIEATNEWTEPVVPDDLKKALSVVPKVQAIWTIITPNAHWDWIRWVRATKNPQTRAHRIVVAVSKLKSGTKRPCCFNRNLCSEPEVSHNGILLGPK